MLTQLEQLADQLAAAPTWQKALIVAAMAAVAAAAIAAGADPHEVLKFIWKAP